jgi:transcriptional regulator with XRE-family HTH domain
MPRVVKHQPQPRDPESEKQLAKLQVTFGSTVRKMRHEQLLTQEELAERAGVHANYISSLERGERNVSLFNIWRIALALSVTVAELTAPLPASVRHKTGSGAKK